MINVDDVVQFNENHKWCGCLGIVKEAKRVLSKSSIDSKEKIDVDIRYMVGVPTLQQGTAFIFVMGSENAIEKIGKAILVLKEENNDVCS